MRRKLGLLAIVLMAAASSLLPFALCFLFVPPPSGDGGPLREEPARGRFARCVRAEDVPNSYGLVDVALETFEPSRPRTAGFTIKIRAFGLDVPGNLRPGQAVRFVREPQHDRR